MADAILVRRANRGDRAALLRFHTALYEQHRDEVLTPDEVLLIAYRDYGRVLQDDVASLLSDSNARVFIAESAREPVGYITGRLVHEPRRVLPRRGVVEDWYVLPSNRGRGVGAQLLSTFEQELSESGCDVLESATWSSNQGACKAHQALGFTEMRVVYRKRL